MARVKRRICCCSRWCRESWPRVIWRGACTARFCLLFGIGGPGSLALMRPDVGQQGDVARPFKGCGQSALVAGARPGLAARLDLAAFRQVAAQPADILIVD